ncbi:hypothetical protein A4X09_0g5458 [Tilletia walkeri]|uniref:Uncharacterized protein n=1 Tax=Tilletia walkeri TaxID=117179 RepID=A0A8X7T315_9BASI|nr:hypothetical protein A4X09_0g5458 [Tilletia walkeri]
MPPSSAESSGVRASGPSSIVPAGTMSPSQRRIQQQQEDDLPSASSSTTTSSHTTTHSTEKHASAKLASDGIHFVAVMVGAVVEVLYEMLAAGILRLPYSLHLEGWSGGNPTLALIVVQWATAAAAADEDDDDDDDDDDEDEAGQDESGVPAGWGVSASEWTNCGRNVFPKNSTNRRTMLSSVPSSPYLRSTSISGTTLPSSPRFGPSVSGGPSTPTSRTNGSTPTRVKGVVELDWSGASASGSVSGSPRIRPLGWTASSAAGGGRAMSYGGGGSNAGAPAMGRRSSASGSMSIVGSASVPGTPAAGTTSTSTSTLLNSPRFSPFFGAVRTVSGSVPILNHSKARALTTTTATAGAGPAGLGLTSLRLRENEEENNEGWDHQERRDGRMRSASISSLASVPELSLGAAAVSLSHGAFQGGGPGPSEALFVESSSSGGGPRQRRGGRGRGRRRRRRRRRRVPLRMFRFAVTYASLVHYLSTVLALRVLVAEVRGWGIPSAEAHHDGSRLVRAVVVVMVCGMSMEGRAKAEGLGLRRSSLGASVMLMMSVFFFLY